MGIVELIKSKPDLISYSPASRDLILQAEEELNLVFSKEYTEYLATLGIAVFEGHEFTGICDGKRLDVIRNTMEQRKFNPSVPEEWYVIECLNIDDIVIWQNEQGEIFRTIPNKKGKKICSTLVEYINKEE